MGQDLQLEEFWEKTKRRRRMADKLLLLKEEWLALEQSVKELEIKKEKEQKDVERLKKAGVRSFFYALTGKRAEKLEKEQLEAETAQKAYEEAFLKLKELERKMELTETEWKSLERYEEKFLRFLESKRKLLSGSGIQAEQDIIENERRRSALCIQEKAILDLEAQNQLFLEQVEQLQKTLEEAERAETVRKYAGTGALDRAQKQTSVLQKELEEFTLGIKTVFEGEEITANLGLVYQFCNGIYTSYIASNSVMQVALLERIRGAKGNAKLLIKQLQELKERLSQKKRVLLSEKRQLEEQRERLIIDTCA